MTTPIPTPCPVCAGTRTVPVVHIPAVPAHCNVHWPSRAEALAAPLGDLDLRSCPACGHFFNAAFDPRLMEYTQAYENSLHFSPRFQAFAEELADHLIARFNLRGRDVIDIGCGKGDFLRLLVSRGGNRGVGFDRSYVASAEDDLPGSPLRFVREFYGEAFAGIPADLVSCRHILEHIPQPRLFLAEIRRTLGPRTGAALYLEVPNALYTLRDMGIWDLIYEHCGYFTADSLRTVCGSEGFRVEDVRETFGGQYLSLEAAPAGRAEGAQGRPDPAMADLAAAFARRYREKLEEWRVVLGRAASAGRRIAVWGAGSKGVTFLNVLKDAAPVEALVDLNPRKHGLHVGGTGLRIGGPEMLRDVRPDLLIVMNPLYVAEIRRHVEALGVRAELLVA